MRNGSYGLIEVKLGGDKLIEEGADNLKTLKNKIDITNTRSSVDGSNWGWRLRVQKAGWSICSSDRLPEGLIE